MKDTRPEIKRRYEDMLLARSGVERLLMGDSMYETARELVVASTRAENPKVTSGELRSALFLRFYGQEFSNEERQEILDALQND